LSSKAWAAAAFSVAPLDQPENVLVALTVDADGADQHNVLGHAQAVDLNDEQVELGDVAGEPFLQSLLRQRHEPARGRRLRRPVTFDAREWSLRQPDGATDLAGGDPDQHQVHGRLAEPVLGGRRCPARQRHLLAVATAHSWPDDIDLAALVANLARVRPQR
jgi:hypothetical protein